MQDGNPDRGAGHGQVAREAQLSSQVAPPSHLMALCSIQRSEQPTSREPTATVQLCAQRPCQLVVFSLNPAGDQECVNEMPEDVDHQSMIDSVRTSCATATPVRPR